MFLETKPAIAMDLLTAMLDFTRGVKSSIAVSRSIAMTHIVSRNIEFSDRLLEPV